jgi:hypothetical protein
LLRWLLLLRWRQLVGVAVFMLVVVAAVADCCGGGGLLRRRRLCPAVENNQPVLVCYYVLPVLLS